MRVKIVAGNWKMNKTFEEAQALTLDLITGARDIQSETRVVLCVPYPYLLTVKNLCVNAPRFSVGAQNCSEHDVGAYTGEVSAAMLQSTGVQYVVLGHSERRQYFGESGKLLATKTDKVLGNAMKPIFCVGEPLEVRERNEHEQLVKKQIEEGLFHLEAAAIQKVVIAYEPVWAIGTGKTATAQQAQEMHAVIRKHLAEKYGAAIADSITILYGGSVNAGNAKELFSCPDVDGGLVGGASLKAAEFITIINAIG